MRIPLLQSIIRRRLLVNYRVDAGVIQKILPSPFKPQLVNGVAIAGVCLIHLDQVRPAFLGSAPLGVQSQNAAHRVAVEWRDEGGALRKGVYITRRDTGSRFVALTGGRLFPGCHYHARFTVNEDPSALELKMVSSDGTTIEIRGQTAPSLAQSSAFRSLAEVSAFFQTGTLGYSPGRRQGCIEGFCLETTGWHVEPFQIDMVRASYFEDRTRFPGGSVAFDDALVMRNIDCQWRAAPNLAG